MEFVGEGLREGIVEDGHGFTEVDSMLAEVGGGLGWIELEVETSEWHREVVCDILSGTRVTVPKRRMGHPAFDGRSRFQKLRVGTRPPTLTGVQSIWRSRR